MKKILLFTYAFLVIAGAQTKPDSVAIKETVANYIEGWNSGNAERMEKSLHPELAKRGITPSRFGKGVEMKKATYTDMINWTKKRPDLLKDDKNLKNSFLIKIFEIGTNIADVKCVSREYVDYLHLSKIDNEWKILNAIWEPNFENLMKK